METINLITIIITIISAFSVLMGVITGIKRGFRRSLIMFILIAVVFAISWFTCGFVAKLVLGYKVEGQTLTNYFVNFFAEQGLPSSVVNLVVNTLIIAIEIMAFILVFLALLLVTATIIYPLAKLIFIKKSNAKRHKTFKSTFAGIIFGILGGVIISYTVCVPVTGLAVEVAKVSKITLGGEQLLPLQESYDVNDYLDTFLGKVYNKTGNKLFWHIATTVDADSGKTYNLGENVDVIVAATDLLNEVQNIGEQDFSEGLNEQNVSALVESLNKMEQTKQSLSENSAEIFNEMLIDLSSSLGEELPIAVPEDFDFSQVNFTEAADAIEVVFDYSKEENAVLSDEEVDVIVTAFADNMIIMSSMQGQTLVTLDEESKSKVNEKLESSSDLTEEQIELLRGLLGMDSE